MEKRNIVNNLKNLIDALGVFILAIVIVFLVFNASLLAIVFQLIRNIILNLLNLNKMILEIKQLFFHVILGADQFGASVIYGKRGLDWYISSIAYYDAHYKKKNVVFMHFINWLFSDEEHCKNSFKDEYKILKRYPTND